MSADREAVDTNVIVYAHFPSSSHHAASFGLLQRADRSEVTLALFPQVVSEFVSIVTNPKRVSPAKSVEEAVQAIRLVIAKPGVTLLPFPEAATETFLALLLAHPVTGPEIFDRQLAAAMSEHGIQSIYTFNTSDFAGLPCIVAKVPPAPVPPSPPPAASPVS